MGEDLPRYDACPHPVYGVIDFVGQGFLDGAAGGAAFHFFRGLRRAPSGGGRLAGGVDAARANAPRVAATLGACCAVFCALESALLAARGRDSIWDSTAAAAATCGAHGMLRGGAPAAARCALLGAMGFVLIVEIDRAIMVWESRSNFLQRQNRGRPAPPLARPSPPPQARHLLAIQLPPHTVAADRRFPWRSSKSNC